MRVILDSLLSKNTGTEGVSEESLKRRLKELAPMRSALKKEKNRFFEPSYARKCLKSVLAKVETFRERFDFVAHIGIGGSSLGAQTLIDALAPRKRSVRFFDNVDPSFVSERLRNLPLKRTLVSVVTKSGSTVETVSLFLLLAKRLKEALGPRWRQNLLVITDPTKGPLRRLAEEHKIESLSIPTKTPGRFSVFTPAGLFSAAFAGVDIGRLLEGAARMDSQTEGSPPEADTSFVCAVADSLLWQKKNILVVFTYSSPLRRLADWLSQLWAESLGKREATDGKIVETGQTPLPALGVTDQHSLLQLFVEGPPDKVYNFIEVEDARNDLSIPEDVFADAEEFTYLGGKELKHLFDSELAGTRNALLERGRPILRLILDSLTAEEVGALMEFLMLRVTYLAGIISVNPFDQPGVELGKRITYSLMGREGYEDSRPSDEDFSADWSFEI